MKKYIRNTEKLLMRKDITRWFRDRDVSLSNILSEQGILMDTNNYF